MSTTNERTFKHSWKTWVPNSHVNTFYAGLLANGDPHTERTLMQPGQTWARTRFLDTNSKHSSHIDIIAKKAALGEREYGGYRHWEGKGRTGVCRRVSCPYGGEACEEGMTLPGCRTWQETGLGCSRAQASKVFLTGVVRKECLGCREQLPCWSVGHLVILKWSFHYRSVWEKQQCQ